MLCRIKYDSNWFSRTKVAHFLQDFIFGGRGVHPSNMQSLSQGWLCSHNFTYCNSETEVAAHNCYPTQSQYTDNGLTSPRTEPIIPGV